MADTQPFLFEIGTEELPPKALKKLADVIKHQLLRQLTEQSLIDAAAQAEVYATPRRLAVFVDAVIEKQPDQTIDRKGPAINQAFDEQGKPTQAAIGFARSVGLEVDQLQTQKTDKGEWLFCQVQKPGQTAKALLPVCIENALKVLPIPKRMRWGNLEAEFVRPVKWLVMLLGSEVIEAEIMSVKSDRYTHGHRFHVTRKLRLRDASEYRLLLEQEGMVTANFDERRQQIVQGITELADEKIAQVLLDEALLDEVTGLVELPIPLMGNFDAEFMQLPQEVLVSSMQDHQKYFPLVDSEGNLLPNFITVSNIRSKDEAGVIQGNERVLRARLSDAQFFWNEDGKTKLADRRPVLSEVLFQQKLGSLGDKVDRISTLATTLAKKFDLDKDQVAQAAELCKLDLVTDMVGEFPELQGIMGKYYALQDGETQQVADAIEQHYWPKFAGDQIPQTDTAKMVAIADKLDTICGLFAINQLPTGDKDPFALRRCALGILRILIEGKLELDLPWAIDEALKGYTINIDHRTHDAVYDFIFERLKTLYQSQGYDTRLYQAVMQTKPVSPLDFDYRLKAVSDFAQLDASESLIEANKRINNILQKAEFHSTDVDEKVVQLDQEKALLERLRVVSENTSSLVEQNRYTDLLQQLTQLKQPIDDFFDNVMVMDEDETKRQNRLVMLDKVRQLFRQVADVSYLK